MGGIQVFEPKGEVHLAALEALGDEGTDFEVLLQIEGSYAGVDVNAFAVERTYLNVYLLVVADGFGLAEAGHR